MKYIQGLARPSQKLLITFVLVFAIGFLLLELSALRPGNSLHPSTPPPPPQHLYKNEQDDFMNNPFTRESLEKFCTDIPKPTHPRGLVFSHKSKDEPIRILRWSQPPYWEPIDWKKESQTLCPFPHELQPFFDRYKEVKVKDMSLPWGKGYAPCYLWREPEETGTCVTKRYGELKFISTHNYTQFREADIVLFHMIFWLHIDAPPYYDEQMLPRRLATQKWVSNFHSESIGFYPFVALPEFNQLHDLTIGSPPDMMDVGNPMYPIQMQTAIDLANVEPAYPFDKTPENYIAFFVSNCWSKNERTDVMEALIEGLGAHSYGACKQNKKVEAEPDGKSESWEDVKKATLKSYPFALAAENSNCRNYVSEKLYDILAIGGIPVYLGAVDIADFVPENSYINVRDFKDYKELIHHIKTVDRSQYFKWKQGVKDDPKSFCKKCFHEPKKMECKILENIEFV